MFSRTSSTSLTGAGPLTGLEWASDRRGPKKCPREVGCRAAPLQATQPPCPCRRSPPPTPRERDRWSAGCKEAERRGRVALRSPTWPWSPPTPFQKTPPPGQLPLLLWGAPEGSSTCYPSSSTERDGGSRGGGPRMQTECGEPHKVRGFLFLAEGKQGLGG